MRLLQSLSFRLALIYVGLFCVSVAALMALHYWLNIQQPLNIVKDRVDREMREMSQIYIVEGRDALVAALEQRETHKSIDEPFHAFIDSNGAPITANLPSWPQDVRPGWIEIEADIHHDGDETDHNSLTRDIRFRDGTRLLLGRDIEEISDLWEVLTETAAWIFSGTIVLGILGGVLMSLAIRRRIEAVNRAALKVIDGDLSGRVPVRGSGDDFDRLGETLNRMLTRIEDSFQMVRRVSDTVAHELRTPLTRLLAKLETAHLASDAETRDAQMGAAIAEAHRLQTIFDALLRISRIEANRHRASMREINLAELTAAVAEFYEPEAEAREVAFSTAIEPNLRATVDPDLLFQALANLVDNALKYTPAGGRVELAASRRRGAVVLTVSDTGPGIAESDIERVTERFYRGPNAGALPGEGLGLSLVAAIVAQHGANLRFRDNRPGLRVEITL